MPATLSFLTGTNAFTVVVVLGSNADENKNLLLLPLDGVVLDTARRHVVRRPIIEVALLFIVTIDTKLCFYVIQNE